MVCRTKTTRGRLSSPPALVITAALAVVIPTVSEATSGIPVFAGGGQNGKIGDTSSVAIEQRVAGAAPAFVFGLCARFPRACTFLGTRLCKIAPATCRRAKKKGEEAAAKAREILERVQKELEDFLRRPPAPGDQKKLEELQTAIEGLKREQVKWGAEHGVLKEQIKALTRRIEVLEARAKARDRLVKRGQQKAAQPESRHLPNHKSLPQQAPECE